MSERLPSLIIGSGNQGVEWAKTRPGVFCLDTDRDLVKPHVYGDIFRLPFPSETFQIVYADFVFNSFVDPGNIPKNTDDPNFGIQHEMSLLLGSESRFTRYPTLLNEAWRVVSKGGNLEIMDLYLNIKTLNYSVWEMEGVLSCQPVEITEDDFDRSMSLEKVEEQGFTAGRMVLRKTI